MIWKHHKKNSLTMVYGFANDTDRKYVAVLSLHKKENSTTIYGFLSKVRLTSEDLNGLWDLLVSIVDTKYLVFEVLPEHAELYKQHLPIESVVKARTFNGYDSEVLRIEMK